MSLEVKQTAIRVLSRRPVYRLLPPGALRACGALLYHCENSSPQRLSALAGRMGSIPTRRLSLAMAAARAAFRAGQDELLETTLAELERRHPEAAAPRILRADLRAYQGAAEQALAAAEQARMLRPSSAPAAARAVRYGYRVHDQETADAAAVAAVARFPSKSEVLWAVCKSCHSVAQATRIHDSWQQAAAGRWDLRHAVRPLALAAARSGQVDRAIDLYRQAMTLIAGDGRGPGRYGETRLGGRGAWAAVQDLRSALDDAGVPFFFAAGTALGLVREGRPLSADSDIDIGILESDWDRDALIDLFRQHPRFDLDPHPQTQKVSLRHRGGSPVDVFRYYREDGKQWHDGVFVRWHNTPFEVERRDIRGLAAPLPTDAETYLKENYGDWRTPDPSFDAFTDAPNLDVTWPEYQRLHFIRRAYKQLVTGDHAAAAAELRRAGEPTLADRVEVSA